MGRMKNALIELQQAGVSDTAVMLFAHTVQHYADMVGPPHQGEWLACEITPLVTVGMARLHVYRGRVIDMRPWAKWFNKYPPRVQELLAALVACDLNHTKEN